MLPILTRGASCLQNSFLLHFPLLGPRRMRTWERLDDLTLTLFFDNNFRACTLVAYAWMDDYFKAIELFPKQSCNVHVSSWFSLGRLYLSKNFSVSSRLSILLVWVVTSPFSSLILLIWVLSLSLFLFFPPDLRTETWFFPDLLIYLVNGLSGLVFHRTRF